MKTILDNVTSEIIIKNSKFITLLIKIDDNTNISNIISKVVKDYPKATHYCYGYITENYKKSSDDGEPGGTAGMPILGVLEKENIIDVLAVVVRYFGGIKLGAGGLVRAYSKSVKEAIKKTSLIDLVDGYKVELIFGYDMQKEIDYLLKDYTVLDKQFLDKVRYTFLIPCDNLAVLSNYNYNVINKQLINKFPKKNDC